MNKKSSCLRPWVVGIALVGWGVMNCSTAQGQYPPQIAGKHRNSYSQGQNLSSPVSPQFLVMETSQLQQLRLAWLGDPVTFGLHLKVRGSKNGWMVSGCVPNEGVRQRVLEIGANQAGVELQDGLRVVSGLCSRFSTGIAPDQLERLAREMLDKNAPETAERVSIAADDRGRIKLSGADLSYAEQLKICLLMRDISHCTGVINRLRAPSMSRLMHTSQSTAILPNQSSQIDEASFPAGPSSASLIPPSDKETTIVIRHPRAVVIHASREGNAPPTASLLEPKKQTNSVAGAAKPVPFPTAEGSSDEREPASKASMPKMPQKKTVWIASSQSKHGSTMQVEHDVLPRAAKKVTNTAASQAVVSAGESHPAHLPSVQNDMTGRFAEPGLPQVSYDPPEVIPSSEEPEEPVQTTRRGNLGPPSEGIASVAWVSPARSADEKQRLIEPIPSPSFHTSPVQVVKAVETPEPLSPRPDNRVVSIPTPNTQPTVPTSSVPKGLPLSTVETLVRKTCGAAAQNVSAQYLSDGRLEIRLQVLNSIQAPQMFRRIVAIPELRMYSKRVRVSVIN